MDKQNIITVNKILKHCPVFIQQHKEFSVVLHLELFKTKLIYWQLKKKRLSRYTKKHKFSTADIIQISKIHSTHIQSFLEISSYNSPIHLMLHVRQNEHFFKKPYKYINPNHKTPPKHYIYSKYKWIFGNCIHNAI